MFLSLLTAIFAVFTAAGLLLCLASGLYSISQYIESHSSKSRRIGHRLTCFAALSQICLVVFDGVPMLPLLPSLVACLLHYAALSNTEWPYITTSSNRSSSDDTAGRAVWSNVAFNVMSILLPFASHVWLVRHHSLTTHAWSRHRYDFHQRPKLPGGRLDWDVDPATSTPVHRELTHLQMCAILVLCVWIVPVWRILGKVAAAEWGSTPAGLATHPQPSKQAISHSTTRL